jgi:tol-pal system protein YbgF
MSIGSGFFIGMMSHIVKKKRLYRRLWGIIFALPFLLSCVYDKEFTYLNDQILVLNKKVRSLEESIDSRVDAKVKASETRLKRDTDSKIENLHSSQAEVGVEIDQLKRRLEELSGRIEDNEHILKRTVERDLSAQDSIREELEKLAESTSKVKELEVMIRQQHRYLGLEPAAIKEEPEGHLKAGDQGRTGIERVAIGEESKSQELALYDRSLDFFRRDKFELAIDGFKRFLGDYSKSDLADNAQFWIGESYMGLKQYEQAILAYQEVIKKYPKGNKTPNAMLRQAVAFLEIKDKTSSRLLLKKLIKKYPGSSEAKIAQTKLKTIK